MRCQICFSQKESLTQACFFDIFMENFGGQSSAGLSFFFSKSAQFFSKNAVFWPKMLSFFLEKEQFLDSVLIWRG